MTNGAAAPRAIREPITDSVGSVHFFNGRLLSAEDLRREQATTAALRRRLARAVGDGVIGGLEVTAAAGSTATEPIVSVTAGSAINREGTGLQLTNGVDVSLAKPPGTSTAPQLTSAGESPFDPCSGVPRVAPFTESGVYLLTIRPATADMGRAPVSGLLNQPAGCNVDFVADAVEFEAWLLSIDAGLIADPAHLRNRVAHLMFGTEDPRRQALESDPFGLSGSLAESAVEAYGLLDDLRATCLTDDQVPLATIFWTPGIGIRFVDMWSVRRRVTRPAATRPWSGAVGDRRLAEGEAMFLQFQGQLRALVSETNPGTLRAAEFFDFLPPVGLVPIGTMSAPGFDYSAFLDGIPRRGPVDIEGAHLEELLRQSFVFPPTELVDDPKRQEAIWVYEVSDNLKPPNTGGAAALQPFFVIANGHLSYRADARMDLAYWNFANFARIG